jgi:hypothetical protein
MQPLKNVFPPSDEVLYVFYDFESTQNTRYSHIATVHVSNLIRIKQFCSGCESSEDVQQDSVQCGKEETLVLGGSGRRCWHIFVNRDPGSDRPL